MTTRFRQTGALALAAAAFATGAFGGGTKTWEHSSRADFEKGKLDKLSLRSDGLLSLAPEFRELHDPSTNYLWAIAQDSKGNVYAGGSGQDNKARVFRVDAAGKGSVLAELAGLEVHAIAVDTQDRVYAATSPDGKVYRLRDGAQPEVYYDPKAKYIWALAFSPTGDLLVATGDKGEVHRVTGPGAGSIFFRTEESHARSMTVAKSGFVYVGTEPSGLIFRVSPAGEGFVLHQASKREITALAAGADGRIYAAAVGVKQAMSAPAAPAPPPAPAPGAPARPAGPAPVASLGSTISGGSEVLRIEADGYPRKVWTHASDIAYTLAFDAAGKLLIGTGNRGAIHRLDTDLLNTLLLTASPTQVTGLAAGRNGAVFAVTGNIGKIYRLGPATEKSGTLESDAMDAGFFTQWGRLSYGGSENGGAVRLETHSGNLDSPRQNWSRWAPVPLQTDGGRVASPPARFLQYRLTLNASADGKSPEVTSIETAYLPKNVAPVVELIETTPANYRFAASTAAVPSQSITLPVLGSGGKASVPGLIVAEAMPGSMSYAKGHVGARWLVTDDNGDATLSTVEIRGAKETAWKLLRANQRERHISWDSTAFPDGDYYLRVRVTDSPSHPPDQALSNELQSDPFVIDNTPPKITGLAGTSNGPKIDVKWHAADALNILARAEYSFDGAEWKSVQPTTQLSDSREHDYTLSIDGAGTGEHTIAVRVTDEYENQAVEKVVVVR